MIACVSCRTDMPSRSIRVTDKGWMCIDKEACNARAESKVRHTIAPAVTVGTLKYVAEQLESIKRALNSPPNNDHVYAAKQAAMRVHHLHDVVTLVIDSDTPPAEYDLGRVQAVVTRLGNLEARVLSAEAWIDTHTSDHREAVQGE